MFELGFQQSYLRDVVKRIVEHVKPNEQDYFTPRMRDILVGATGEELIAIIFIGNSGNYGNIICEIQTLRQLENEISGHESIQCEVIDVTTFWKDSKF